MVTNVTKKVVTGTNYVDFQVENSVRNGSQLVIEAKKGHVFIVEDCGQR